VIYNGIIISAITAWASAQIIKTLLHFVKFKHFYAQRLIGAGGMPSSHTSLVISVLLSVARKDGVASTMFGIMFILAAVVIYDAMGVRRAAGQHAKEINRMKEIFADINDDDDEKHIKHDEKKLQEYLGHTPLEVLGGALLGIIVAMIVPINI